jgi:hypothetical protein
LRLHTLFFAFTGISFSLTKRQRMPVKDAAENAVPVPRKSWQGKKASCKVRPPVTSHPTPEPPASPLKKNLPFLLRFFVIFTKPDQYAGKWK